MEGTSKVAREGFIGEVDLAFNDLYTRHVFQTAQRLQAPTHTIVLGDVFSSEFIEEEEFVNRTRRFRDIFVRIFLFLLLKDFVGGPFFLHSETETEGSS